MTNRLLTPAQTAAFLNVSRRTIEGWRLRRTGPSFIRVNACCIRYDPAELRRWLETQSTRAA